MATRVLLSVKQFAEKHCAFTVGALRNFIHMARPRRSANGLVPGNGFDSVITRAGRRIYLDEAEFFAWLARINGRGAK